MRPTSLRRDPVRTAATLTVATAAAAALWLLPASASSQQERLPPRPELSPETYAAEVAELRRRYTQPREQWPAPEVDPGVEWVELGPVPDSAFPEDNAFSEQKAALGQQLFFDARLSGPGQMACVSCHAPELGWTDGRTVSLGDEVSELHRNAQSLLNAGHLDRLFWDGRADSLEEQAQIAILNPDEMAADPDVVVATLDEIPDYVDAFERVFGTREITLERIGRAIATYVRTLHSRGRSDFDRFMAGEADALDDAALRGLHLFRTTARCMNCHHGPLLTDEKFHDLGLSYYGRKYEDLGRYRVTHDPADVGRFRTPPLRNVARTAPYMHNGMFQLEGVLNMYNAGMPTLKRKEHQADDPLFPTKSPHLRSLGLNKQDLRDLTAFLESLTERPRRVRAPELPPDPS